MQKSRTVLFTFLAILILLVNGCSSDDGSDGDTSWTDGRTECVQATDCGEGGRNEWVCRDGYCFTVDEFCFSNEECIGNCVNHTCENGKIADGDEVVVDGDDDLELELEPEQIPCEYLCCTDADCGDNAYCDTTKHECVVKVDCADDKECCQDHDCQVNPLFGDNYICMLNKCVDKDNPCPYECCENSDCATGYICVIDDDEQGYHCQNNSFSCTPGNKTCCMYDPGNPDCNEQGDLKTEIILTCNTEGNDYDIGWCPEFHDCKLDSTQTDVECTYNGRCSVDNDCDCPKKCIDTPTVKKCMLPTNLQSGDKCAEKACGGTEVILTGKCAEGLTCMLDAEAGYCQVESK